ncbi:MAG: hypothetical protein M1543_03115, partial [Firmicutes bacterium]|nr:hypothetical protein [Bacillota bacterium]
ITVTYSNCPTQDKTETEPVKKSVKKSKKAASPAATAGSKRKTKEAAVVVKGDNLGQKKTGGKIASGR